MRTEHPREAGKRNLSGIAQDYTAKSEDRLGGGGHYETGEEGQGPGLHGNRERGAGYPSPWKRRRGGVPLLSRMRCLLEIASGRSLSPAPLA